MTTLSIEVDESVENYLRNQNIPLHSYLGNLIKEDMLLNEIELSKASGRHRLNSVDDLDD